MTTHRKTTTVALATACVSLAAAAPFALADQPDGRPNGPKTTTTSVTTTTAPSTTTTPTTTTPTTAPTPAEKRHGYGVRCRGLSKKHVKGQKGTPFSRCVVALAKIDAGKTTSPRVACKGLSKKHVKGQKGTPFSRCVVAATAQLKATRQAG
jgi:hypothetical protein